MSRVGSTSESPRVASDYPEESTTPVHTRISFPHASTVASGREGPVFSASSLSPATFAQTPTGSYGLAAKEDPASNHKSATQWGPNWYFNGIAMSSEPGREWISKRTGQPVSWADFSIPIMQFSEASALRPSLSEAICELPDIEATREVITAFFKSSFRLAFPVLDETLFVKTIETAYEPVEGTLCSLRQVSARACVLSMLAIAPRLAMSRQISFPMDADLCAAQAHCLLLHVAEDVSLPTLQAAIILVSLWCTDCWGYTS